MKFDRENTPEGIEKLNTVNPDTETEDTGEEVDDALWQRLWDPSFLRTVTMRELYSQVYESRPYLIDGLLRTGTYLFAGAPKVGKSFFMAQLAYHVSAGLPLWSHSIKQGTVLYLALEDDYRRLQERMYRMFGTDSTDDLFFAVCAKQLGMWLDEQLEGFVREHPDTRLIIIDTLQKIREVSGDKYSYASDYEVVGRLKKFADYHNVSLLLVHHTRKQTADDRFDMISGTNGLLGAADGAFLLQKIKRTDQTATLEISGRDQQDQKLYLRRNPERLTWELERTEADVWEEPPDPVLASVSSLVSPENPVWRGTATEMAAALHSELKPNALAMKLNIRANAMLEKHHIRYESSRSHAGRQIRLTLLPEAA